MGVAISSLSRLFAVPVITLHFVWVGLGKSKLTNLGCEKHFCKVAYRVPLEMLKWKETFYYAVVAAREPHNFSHNEPAECESETKHVQNTYDIEKIVGT